MRFAPSFHSRILPSRSLPMTEYSVEDSSTLPMKSSAFSALPITVLSKNFAPMAPPFDIQGRNALAHRVGQTRLNSVCSGSGHAIKRLPHVHSLLLNRDVNHK